MFSRASFTVIVLSVVACAMLVVGCRLAPSPEVTPVEPTATQTPAPAAPTATASATVSLPETPTITPMNSVTPTSQPQASPTETPTAAPTPQTSPAVTPIPTPGEAYEDQREPVRLLASYYNAIDRREYQRAWGYWETPPNPSYEDFVHGYADTASVLLVVRPPIRFEGAAGSVYVGVPTLLVSTHYDGTQHAFVGCYVARRSNIGPDDQQWSLYDASLQPTPDNSADATLVVGVCEPSDPHYADLQFDDRSDPVHLLASYYNAVNRGEYRRAWEYWETPPNPSYEDFVQGYADTAWVLLVVRPPTHWGVAAGSTYVEIPALMISTHHDGTQHGFVGCYVGRTSNIGLYGQAADESWSLYDATVGPARGDITDVTLLAQACPTQE